MTDTLISRVPRSMDLALYAGDGVAIRFTVAYSNGDPFPLEGEATSQIKAKRADLEPLVTFAVDDSGMADGIFVISLTGEQTAELTAVKSPFKGFWDLQVKPTGAEPLTFIQGKVTCYADVTR